MILVVSSATDEHARLVMAELDRLGAEHRLLDLSRFPRETRLSMRYDRSGPSHVLSIEPGDEIAVERVRAVWWRRPQPYEVDAAISRASHRAFALNESHEVFAGFWQSLDVEWVNHPTRDEVAARKAFQLRVAQECGLRIPRTLMTNDPDEAARFIAELGEHGAVCKAFSATPREWRETRLIGEAERAVLDNVRHAPVIFQEYIPAGADLRITIVGEEIFPAAIHSADTRYAVDFRIDMNRARVEPAELPAEVESGLRRFMNRLGLVYGAVDMRRTPAGEHVFLEVNPAGQWLFVEQRTGQPITSALARWLANGSAPAGRRSLSAGP